MNALFLRGSTRRALSLLALCLFATGVFGAATVERPVATQLLKADAPAESRQPSNSGDAIEDPTPPDRTTSTSVADAVTTTPTTAPATSPKPTTPPSATMTVHQPMTLQSGIYITSTDGGAGRRIVGGNLIGGYSFSPDGKQLAYSAENRIWIVPTAGGLARALTPAVYLTYSAWWSPSGRYLAYLASDTGEEPSAHVIDLTTGEDVKLRRAMSGGGTSHMAWHPTRDVLAYFTHPELVVYDVVKKQTAEVASVGGMPPMAWSPAGDAIAFRDGNDLGLITFADPTNFTGGAGRKLAPAYGAVDPTWVGDDVFFVNPWKLEAIKRDGSGGRSVVGDYVGTVRHQPSRPSDLFLAIVPDTTHTELRQIERSGLDGSGRRVIATAPRGHALYTFEVAPAGDLIAFNVGGE